VHRVSSGCARAVLAHTHAILASCNKCGGVERFCRRRILEHSGVCVLSTFSSARLLICPAALLIRSAFPWEMPKYAQKYGFTMIRHIS
jgi:hypothetical protein